MAKSAKQKSKAANAPTFSLIERLAELAARYGDRAHNEPEANLATLYAGQAKDVVRLLAGHYIGAEFGELKAAEVLRRVRVALADEWPGDVDGWRQYALRAIELGGMVGMAYSPLVHIAMNGMAAVENPAAAARLRGRAATNGINESAIHAATKFVQGMGVENWVAAVKYLADAELPRANNSKRRSCYERDHQWLRQKNDGLTPAKIRDLWNRLHPDDPVERETVKKGIEKARAELKSGRK